METQNDILLDLQEEVDHEPASAGLRFINFLIDIVVFSILLQIIEFSTGLLFFTGNVVVNNLISSLELVVCYTICEGLFKGKSIGKFATKTKVVKEDGTSLQWSDILVRSLCRIVPFEPLSIIGGYRMWHDKWSKTIVVKDRI